MAGGSHAMKATLPDLTSMLRLDGGSGAVFMDAVHVSQSLMVLRVKSSHETQLSYRLMYQILLMYLLE